MTLLVRRDPAPGEALLDLDGHRVDASRLEQRSLDGFDAVFHLAGEPITPTRWGPLKRESIRASRVVSTHTLARSLAGLTAPPPVLVCASAIGIYGDRGDEILDEESASGSGFLADVCRAWEAAAAPARDSGIRVVHARTGIVLGPGGGFVKQLAPLFRAGLGARLGSGQQWQSWIALADEVDALVHLATTSALSGACNLVAPEPVRNAELAAAFAAAFHKRARLAIPAPLLKAGLGLSAREVALVSQRVVPARLAADGFVHRIGALADALALAVGAAH